MRKKVFGIVGFVLAVLLGLFLWLPTQYVVPILMYHSVASEYIEPLNNVRPESFARQMVFLKKHGYHVISAADLVSGLKGKQKFAFNTVVITFDDGLENNYTLAYPILKIHGFPATIFVPCDKVDSPGRLTWEQVRELAANGITIGSHTRTEAYVPDADSGRLSDEIAGSKRVLEKQLGRRVDFISYPVGGFTEKATAIVREAGYQAAFTTNRGRNKRNDDLFALRRIRIKDSDDGLVFLAKLSGFYNFFRSARSPH